MRALALPLILTLIGCGGSATREAVLGEYDLVSGGGVQGRAEEAGLLLELEDDGTYSLTATALGLEDARITWNPSFSLSHGDGACFGFQIWEEGGPDGSGVICGDVLTLERGGSLAYLKRK